MNNAGLFYQYCYLVNVNTECRYALADVISTDIYMTCKEMFCSKNCVSREFGDLLSREVFINTKTINHSC